MRDGKSADIFVVTSKLDLRSFRSKWFFIKAGFSECARTQRLGRIQPVHVDFDEASRPYSSSISQVKSPQELHQLLTAFLHRESERWKGVVEAASRMYDLLRLARH
jgi:hypothetical protein